MSQLKSILLAIEMATRKRDELIRAAGRLQKNLEFAQNQMDQLTGYAADTDARWVGPTAQSRSAELIRHHYQFMERLQQAIALQSGAIDSSARQLEAGRQLLLQAEYRLAGLNQLLKDRQALMLVKERRSEQRQSDEFAALLHARNRHLSKEKHHDD